MATKKVAAIIPEEEVANQHLPSTAKPQKRTQEEVGDGDKKWAGWPGDNVFRLVVPVEKVYDIIETKGELLAKIRKDTRARIKILDRVPGTAECIVLVSAREDPDVGLSPAMDGLLRVHRLVVEGGSDRDGEDGHTEPRAGGGRVSSRLLVSATQASSFFGRQGPTTKSIQDASGARVRVLSREELPVFALSDDRVVKIQGDASNVCRAMELVVSHLRKFLVDQSVLPLFELNHLVATASQSQQQQNQQQNWPGQSSSTGLFSSSGGCLASNLHYGGVAAPNDNLIMNYYPSPLEILHDSHHHHLGISMYGRDPRDVISIYGRGPQDVRELSNSVVAAPTLVPIIIQMTQKIQIPLSYVNAIIGRAGTNINHMRRRSGASITILETRKVPGEMTVEIHGSPIQVQTAQQLTQDFMARATEAASVRPSYSPVDPGCSIYGNQASLYTSAGANIGHSTAAAYPSRYNSSYGC